MYGQDLNTLQGHIAATAYAMAEDFGHMYGGVVAGLHVFELPTALGTFTTKCTDEDLLDGTLIMMFMEDLSR